MRKLLGALCALLLGGTVAFAANPQVEIKTNLGSITVELYADKAPQTVKNFLEYVQGDYYKGTLFHRVIPGFMIQGGGYSQDFTQKPTRDPIQNEAANGLKNETGTIAMARTPNPHSATAQFFINVADNAFLNHTAPTARGYGYTVFGKVVKGMDVVDRIAQLPTGPGGPFPQDVPKQEVVIQGARIVEAK
ncbi:MAG TPA: peptidylprolyl isomerase [Burkholderiales bacterium]|nr:peptidylprolyl isomerase [Burkholderiales bacterium]